MCCSNFFIHCIHGLTFALASLWCHRYFLLFILLPHCILNFSVFIAGAAAAETNNLHGTGHRTYRLEKPNAVTSGKWYFEMEVLTSGPMRIGWVEVTSQPGKELGSDDKSWAFDGFRVSISFLSFNSSHLRLSNKDNYFTLQLQKVKYIHLIVT